MKTRDILYKIMHWESWHWHAKYIPLYPVWLWYCLRARSWWFFTPSNPTLTFGGFEGEPKKEMYDQLPPGSYPDTIYISPLWDINKVKHLVLSNKFSYPCIVKPDVGMMGLMFRKISSEFELEKYHAAMPAEYLIQAYSLYPLEVSVFYYRYPGEQKGHITGFIKKEFLQVVGNGKSTLRELIQGYSRVRFRLEEMLSKHAGQLQEVLPAGRIFYLSYALNLSRGGKLVSLANEKDERLLHLFDNLSHYTKTFFYGRYDIKCQSVESLKSARDFTILEYNGCGAEPHHAYGNRNNLLQAYTIFLHHWKVLYSISRINHKNGIPYWSFSRGLNHLIASRRHFKKLREADRKFPSS